MSKYMHKSKEQLLWNRTRRTLTREMDTNIMNWREEALNDLIFGAYEAHAKAISSGEKLELGTNYRDWISIALSQYVGQPEIEGPNEVGK